MSDVKDIPVPGQMDLDLSDGEEKDVIHVPSKKKGREDVKAATSPQKRPAPDAENGVTLASITALLQAQMQEIRTNHRAELNAAIKASEEKIQGTVQLLKSDFQKQILDTNEGVAQLQDTQKSLMARIDVLERGSAPRGAASELAERKPTLVWGGWREDTRRQLILKDLEHAIADMNLQDQLDGQPWVPGSRHSIAFLEFEKRQGEDDRAVQLRMNGVTRAVAAAGIKTENLQENRAIWCAVSRARQDRDGNGSHAGKIRKLLHWSNTDMSLVDCSYRQGSVWLQDTMVGSVTKAAPNVNVLKGKMQGSWVDVAAIAKILGKQKDQLERQWENIVLMWGGN